MLKHKSKGLPDNKSNNEALETILEQALEMELTMLDDKELYDDDLLENRIQRVVNKVCQKNIGRKPITTVFINRID